MVKLSKTSKMGCQSWSLQAIETCPGAIAKHGGLVDACKGCYATTGNYHYPNVKKPRLENRQDWQRDEWISEMVAALKNDRYFRWFDSGDMYSVKLAEKIYQVMQQTPHCQHWLPTRQLKFDKFKPIVAKMRRLKNVVVRFSSDSVTGQYNKRIHGSVIVPDASFNTDARLCTAYQRQGSCGPCRDCWDKNVKTIAYPAHGVKMRKVINIKLAA